MHRVSWVANQKVREVYQIIIQINHTDCVLFIYNKKLVVNRKIRTCNEVFISVVNLAFKKVKFQKSKLIFTITSPSCGIG